MAMTTEEIKASLEPMLKEAEVTGKWLYCVTVDMVVSPYELRRLLNEGRCVYSPRYWDFVDPESYI